MNRTTLNEIAAIKAAHHPAALLTFLPTGQQHIIGPKEESPLPPPFGMDIVERANQAIRRDKSATFDTEQGRVFVQVINPPLRMIIVGAVHIAQALIPMAISAGYAVTVVDPRRGFASADRFPGLTVIQEWPDDALEQLSPDTRTAVITLTHDPKLDDPALRLALSSPCFYIGSLGSRKTHAARLERLKAANVGEEALARIHGPIGLAIGAQSPVEVAISIMSQVTQVLRQGKTQA